jgi:hypothetical protein
MGARKQKGKVFVSITPAQVKEIDNRGKKISCIKQ